MDTLFIEELDGTTFASMDDLFTWEDSQRDAGPTWSYYGGWVN